MHRHLRGGSPARRPCLPPAQGTQAPTYSLGGVTSVPFHVPFLGGAHTVCSCAEKRPRKPNGGGAWAQIPSATHGRRALVDAARVSVSREHATQGTRGQGHSWSSRWFSHKA